MRVNLSLIAGALTVALAAAIELVGVVMYPRCAPLIVYISATTTSCR